MVSFKVWIRNRIFTVLLSVLGSTTLISTAVFANISLPEGVGTGVFRNCIFNPNAAEVTCSSITNFNDQNYTINITEPLELIVQGDLTLPGGLTINPQEQPFSLRVAGRLQNNGNLRIHGNLEASTITLSGSDSQITGHIQANEFTMNAGSMIGDIDAGIVILNSPTEVFGTVFARELTTNGNATVNGNVVVSDRLMNNGTITGNARAIKPTTSVTAELIRNNGSGFIGSINSNGTVYNDGSIGTYINTPKLEGNNKNPPILCNTNPQDRNTSPCVSGEIAQDYCEGVLEGLEYAIIGTSGFNYSNNNYINGERISTPAGFVGRATTPTPTGEVASVAPSFAPLSVNFPNDKFGSNTITEQQNIPPGSYGTVRTVQGGGPPSGNVVSFTGGASYDYSDEAKIYYIKRLELKGNDSRAVFGPGIYFIDEFVANSKSFIDIDPSGKVIIHVGTRFRSDNETYINSRPGANTGNLIINMHSGATFRIANGNNGTDLFNFNGFIYSPYENTTITLDNNNAVIGSVLSSGTVSVGNNTTFEFTDEVRRQIIASTECGTSIGPTIERFLIEQPSNMISCRAAPVRIIACANSDCSERFGGPITATLQSNSSVSWQGGTLVSNTEQSAVVNFIDGQAQVGMRNISGGAVQLSVAQSEPAVASPPLCTSPNCTTNFATSGLDVSTQLINRAGDFVSSHIAAVETAPDGTCKPRLRNQSLPIRVTLNCTDPSCAANQNFSLYDELQIPLPLSFGFNDVEFDQEGQVTILHRYTDVGQFLLNAEVSLEETPSPELPDINDPEIILRGVSAPFYATPYSLEAFAYKGGQRFSDLSEVFAIAGEPFQVEIQALNKFGNPTPSFGRESIEPSVSLAYARSTQPQPSTPSEHDEVNSAQLHLNNISRTFSAGSLIVNGVVWDEVGELHAKAVLDRYFTLSASGYPDFFSGIVSEPGQLSRFIPDYFELGLSNVVNAFNHEQTEQTSCSDIEFTYLGQPVAAVQYEVLARNAKGGLTLNYDQTYYEANNLSQPSFTFHSRSLGPERLNYRPQTEGWTAGRYFLDAEDFIVERWTDLRPDGPYPDEWLSISISGRQRDHDSVTFRAEEVELEGGIPVARLDGTLNLLYGRLVLNDISGSELEPLPILGSLETFSYYPNPLHGSGNELAQFRTATFDQCTVIAGNQFKRVSGPDVNLIGNDSELSAGRIKHEQFNWGLADPFSEDNAELRFEYDINSQPWLGFPWRLPEVNQSPEALAIFGQFRGNDRVIYWLERGL